MREINDQPLPNPSSFIQGLPPAEVPPLKEGFQLLTGNFWALIGPYLVLGLLGACALQGLWDIVFGTAIMMGANISLLEYKANGTPFGFGRTISVGFSNWWNGFKINFVTGLYAGAVVLCAFMAIMPGVLMLDKQPVVGGTLLGAGSLFTLYAFYWFYCRACLTQVCMADKGTSASVSFNKAWEMAKANQPVIRPIILTFCGLWLVALIVFVLLVFANVGLAQDIREGVGMAVLMVSPLYCIVLSYQRLVLNLAYQKLRGQAVADAADSTTIASA
jgi:hypothetical protein